ncbi:MAG: DUF4258 domain-containing protein [Parachlamydiales bacterium]
MQMMAGAAEVSARVATSLYSSGLITGTGCFVAAHGLDQMTAGVETMLSGQKAFTRSEQVLQGMGASSQTAALINDSLSIGGTFGSLWAVNTSRGMAARSFRMPECFEQTHEFSTSSNTRNGFLGHKSFELENPPYQKSARNVSKEIQGRFYSRHALDQMQNRGILPSIVENTIKDGQIFHGNKPNTFLYYDSINNVSVITNT